MELINKICLAVAVGIVVFIAGVFVGQKQVQHSAGTSAIMVDTTYNTIILDSIEYNIIRKDSIIYNLKEEMRDEVIRSFELNDSNSIKLFFKLCWQP